jgi:hypothetical protein
MKAQQTSAPFPIVCSPETPRNDRVTGNGIAKVISRIKLKKSSFILLLLLLLQAYLTCLD